MLLSIEPTFVHITHSKCNRAACGIWQPFDAESRGCEVVRQGEIASNADYFKI